MIAALVLAGCLGPPAAPGEEWYLGGSFTEGFTQEDIEAVCRAGAGRDACAIMESYPPQFGFRFPSQAECEAARAKIAAIPHTTVRACARIEPRGDPETPTQSGERRPLDVRTFRVTWWDGEPDSRRHDMSWEVVEAFRQDGLATISTTTHGIEGGDFRFQLWYRADGSGALAHETGAPRPGTFDFRYTEAEFWSARPVTRVASVDPRSFVEVHGEARGSFLLDFVGACDGCGDDDRPQRTVLEGSFGP